jgi:Zn-dependent protease with chaperone function
VTGPRVEFDAAYFDGRSSRRYPVRVRAQDGRLAVSGEEVALDIPLADVRTEPPIAGSLHVLHLPAGALLRTADAAAVEAVFPRGASHGRWVRKLEGRWTAALASLAFIAGFAAWTILFGVPMGAKWGAEKMPDALWRDMGQQSLRVLDSSFCSASMLTEQRQAQVEALLKRVTKGMPDWGRYGLELRSCRTIGPNALALPDGTIVVTDELVRIAQDDEEIAAVLAHELGHLRNNHPSRMALQSAGVAAVVAVLASDAVSITGLAAALPVLLLESGYSRGFEEEADGFALDRLREIGISPSRFADALQRLEDAHAKKTKARSDAASNDYLSTHPTTARRIERARQAAK